MKAGMGTETGRPGQDAPKKKRPAPPPEEIAKHFPQLEIIGLLGQGGMGMVYKARQPQLDRFVALKILSPDLSRNPAFAERFTREARALARLNHPNIVAVYDFGKAGDFYFFIMEYVDGMSLWQMELTQKPLAPTEALAIVPKICDALQYAHDEGIVHRDIKPGNILLDKKGRVKIADFGLAKLMGQDARDFTLTQSKMAMGTPQYMAPEQMEHPLQTDHRADIYSLGVVFYEMLTGELPMGRFDPPSRRVQVDVRLDEVVLRSLERDVQRRYQQASEVKTAVESITTGSLVSQPTAAPSRDAASQPPPKPERNRSVWLPRLGIAVLVILTAIALALFWIKPPQPLFYTFSGRTEFVKSPNGPALSKKFIRKMGISPLQVEALNKILQNSYREFVSMERQHTEFTKDEHGHVRVTINPFPEESMALFTRTASEIRGTIGRDAIPPPTPGNLHTIGLFRHAGEAQVTAELWKDGAVYHFTEKHGMRPIPGGNASLGRRGAEGKDWHWVFPEEYWIYWSEPSPGGA
jgi:serine/threonine protein kinase